MQETIDSLIKKLSESEQEIDNIKNHITGIRWTVRCTCPNAGKEQQDPSCGKHLIEALITRLGWEDLFKK